MHAVMGTMRKMEDLAMEDKMMVTSNDRLHAAPLNGVAPRKRSLGGGSASVGGRNTNKPSLREVDKWKRVAAYKAATKQRPTASSTAEPAYLNGRKVNGRRERDDRLAETPSDATGGTRSTNQGAATCTGRSGFVEENLPMDLSRRTTDDDRLREWSVDEDEDDEPEHHRGNGNGRRHRGDDHFVRFAVGRGDDDEMSARFDEPLNLSRTCTDPLEIPTRWNGHQTRAPASSGHSTNSGSSDEHHGQSQSSHGSAPPVLQQKRVRLEEMVNLIRKCSGVEDPARRHDDVNTVHHNGGHNWSRNHHHYNQLERRRHPYQRHLPTNGGNYNGDDGYDIARNGADEYTDEEDDEMDVAVNGHHAPHRKSTLQSDYDDRREMATHSPSYHQQHQQQQRRRRKSATPYRGGYTTSPPPTNYSPRSAHRRADNYHAEEERRRRSPDYDFEDRPEHQPIRLEVIAASSTALPTTNGLHSMSYPMLRQKLQERHPASTQTTSTLSPDHHVDDRTSTPDEDDQQPDVVRSHGRAHPFRHRKRHDMDEMETDDHDRHSNGEASLRGVHPLLTQHQHLQNLLAATATPLPFYVHSVWQGLQGSLVVTDANTSPVGSQPLTLKLPLSMNGSGPRSESPRSIEDDDDDEQSSPETPHHKNSGGGIVTSGATHGGGLVAIASEVANGALFRKRAPRALTGKHVKHGTGASPTTLLTLRQKIEQKQQQQLVAPTVKPSGGGQKSKAGSEGNAVLLKAIKASTLLQKKTMVS